VLVISVVVLAIIVTVTLTSIGEGQSSLALTQGEQELNFAEGCMEDALLLVQKSAAYNGGSITRPEGTCTITTNNVGNVWTITAATNSTQYKRTIEVIASRTSSLVITSWREI
jgi:hypothetical protein